MEKREVVQEKCVELIQANEFTGLYLVAPRVGKSKIVIDALEARFYTWKMRIASPTVSVNEAWDKEFLRWGPFPCGPIDLDTLCFASLKKIPEDLDCLIIDEPQKLSLAQMKWIKKKNPKRLLMITGTANKYTRSILKYQLGIDVEYEYTMEEAITDGIIANFQLYIVRVPLDSNRKNILTGPKGNKFWVSEHQAYAYHNTMFEKFKQDEKIKPELGPLKEGAARRRAEMLYRGKRKIEIAKWIGDKINERVLMFTTRTEIADQLAPYSYHSKNKTEDNLNRFMNEEINTLAVVQMSDMGITFPDLKYEVVHQLQSNNEQSIQKFLRAANLEGDKKAKIVITVYKDTVDEGWARQAIEGIPTDKVTWVELEELTDLMNGL